MKHSATIPENIDDTKHCFRRGALAFSLSLADDEPVTEAERLAGTLLKEPNSGDLHRLFIATTSFPSMFDVRSKRN